MPSHRFPADSFSEAGIPDLGMDTDTVPRLMSPRKAQLLKNFLMDRPGVLPMRGPLCEGTAWNLGSAIAAAGAWVFDDKLLVSRYSGTIAAPTGVAAVAVNYDGSNIGLATLYYKVTALNAGGETIASAEVSATPTFAQPNVAISWTPVAGATSYRVYRGTTAGGESKYAVVASSGFDDAASVVWTNATPPNVNTATSGATRDTWVAPYRKTASANQLRVMNLTSKVVDLVGNSASDLAAATADGVPGIKSVRVGPFVYGPAGDSATTVTQNGYIYKKAPLLRWDGSLTPVVLTHGPKCAQDITYHYNRLFVLGGIAEGGTAIQFNSLYWSDQVATDGTALPDTAAAWQDDVSGLTNQLVVGSDDGSDFGVALAHVGANLMILKRRSLWVLYGTSPSNWTIKQISDEVGCIDPRSVVPYEQGVLFMSPRGFMFYDGTRLQNVSEGLRSTLLVNALARVGPTGVDGGYVRAVHLGYGYVLVTAGIVDGNTLATTADTDAWLYYVPGNAWEQLSSSALTAIVGGGRTTNHTYLLMDQRIVKANYLLNPSAAPANTRGFDSVDGNATQYVIPSRWTSRALDLAAPVSDSRLQRITCEYYWSLANGGWQIVATVRGPAGVTTASTTLGAPTGITASLPARGGFDILNETDEIYLDVQATSSAPATFDKAELHRLLLEYRPTHRTKAAL